MTTIQFTTSNARSGRSFRKLFRTRDFFFHNGKTLRRVSIAVPAQLGMAVVALMLVCWSFFAAAQLLIAKPVAPAELARMEREVQAMQADVQAIQLAAERRYQLTAREVRKLGIDPQRLAQGGVGGPFEAVTPLKANPTFKQLFTSWKKLDSIEQGTIAIPSTEPVKGMSLTSGYGVRSDPFRGRAAMHAGIDLAAPIGTPIYATADGFVQRSEWAGGYGNLVELSHGKGIQTRFGHLSRSLVKAGQRVKRGDLIALMGSTGRSTGSHLHYEVRIDGKAVNPVPFMKSNDYLLAVQRRAAAAATQQVAMGGPSVAAK